MNVKLLIDGIVRQTTVLIAQLSTAAGIRAPLSHIADQVFFELSREIEQQGVSRKVAADMFGLALRSYQKKVQRLAESATDRDRSLWESVLNYLRENGSKSRAHITLRFSSDDAISIAAVLNDLVTSGLVYRTGAGASSLYGVTAEADYGKLVQDQELESATTLIWQVIYRHPRSTAVQLLERLNIPATLLEPALARLLEQGHITTESTADGAAYSAESLILPVGAEHGWEAAVSDHFQAMVSAIACKLRLGQARSSEGDVVGGATLSFDVGATHPMRAEVLGLLSLVRQQVSDMWDRVEAYNREHPQQEDVATKVWFYFGQYLTPTEENAHED